MAVLKPMAWSSIFGAMPSPFTTPSPRTSKPDMENDMVEDQTDSDHDDCAKPDLKRCLNFVKPSNVPGSDSESSNIADKHKYKVAPLFTGQILALSDTNFSDSSRNSSQEDLYPKYALLGALGEASTASIIEGMPENDLVFSNASEPWSAFICGIQGSGKSHTLSCLLENSLLAKSPVGYLKAPMTGMIFHYDKFSTFDSGQLCEAAYLCSSGIPVRVLVAPTSEQRMRKQYTNLPNLPRDGPKPQVVPLYLRQNQLSADIIMTLMAVQDTGVAAPLYISATLQLLRDMALHNQNRPGFDYKDFMNRLDQLTLTEGQIAPLQLRLNLLNSMLLDEEQEDPETFAVHSDTWKPQPGSLTIVDLSDQFVNEADACALFSICLKLFMGGWRSSPRIFALDEAHKFLTSSAEATKLTTDLIAIIRQQRHLSSRVVIATQEPTVSGALLDLCNVSIVHRFNSPQWYSTLRQHLAGAHSDNADTNEVFQKIVQLSTGEALVFCPTAVLSETGGRPDVLRDGYFKLNVRYRISADGGQSILPSDVLEAQSDLEYTQIDGPALNRVKAQTFGGKAKKGKQAAFGINSKAYASAPTIEPILSGAQAFISDTSSSSVSTGSSAEGVALPIRQQEPPKANNSNASKQKAVQAVPSAFKAAKTNKSQPTAPIAIKHGKISINEVDLRRYMYNAVKAYFGDNTIKDPSGAIAQLLNEVEAQCGLPKNYLLQQQFRAGCEHTDSKAMMKDVIKRYYDDKGVTRKKRADYK
ncbi:hypothetical protein PMZ80_003277 [Knufia obscura]|nr:hypothetical protein PMZ80_003277 [Knufia obscura]